jgi:hypothetical protein
MIDSSRRRGGGSFVRWLGQMVVARWWPLIVGAA